MAKAHKPATIFDSLDFPDYVFTEFPKILYAPAENTLGYTTTVVATPSDERALGKGWYTNPKDAIGAATPTK